MKEVAVVLGVFAVILVIAPFFGMVVSGAFITAWIVGIPALMAWVCWKWLSKRKKESNV